MFRCWLPLLLIAGLVLLPQPFLVAQAAQDLSSVPPIPLIDGKIYLKVSANYDALRRGARMEIAIVPYRHHQVPHMESLPVFLRSAPSLKPESVSTRLEFDPVEGLSLNNLQPHSKARLFPFSGQPVEVLTPAFKNRPVAFRVRVTASKAAQPGIYVLHGKLTYREVDDHGISEPHVAPFEISLCVVNQTDKVNKDRYWAFDQSQAKETTVLVLLTPVLIPLAAVAGVICLATWGRCAD